MALHSNVTPTEPGQVKPSQEVDLVSALDERITALLKLCHELKVENEKLRAERDGWDSERQDLIEKCSYAEQGIEKAISRLEALAKEK